MFSYTSDAATSTDGSFVCNQPYALCDASPCIPIPGIKDKAICFCSVFNGVSMGNLSCDKRKPFKNQHGEVHLVSNYSFANAKFNHLMTCPAGHRWTFCLDKSCIVDPRNPNNAICTCDIKYTQTYVTFGGECDTNTCADTLYSAATTQDIENGNNALMQALNLTQPPLTACPISNK